MHLIIGTYTEQLPHVHGKADGILAASFDPDSGRIGPVTSLAAACNAHMIASDPVTGDILVADLGSDTVLVYSLDHEGRLIPKTAANLTAVPGAGPRHLAFHPDGRHLFIVHELDSTVSALRREDDHFAVTDRVLTWPAGAGGQNLAGAIRVTPSGRHVLVSNRGHDSLAVLRFDRGSSALSLVGLTPNAGECPRDFTLAPDGRHVIVAGQDNDQLACYAFDDETGALRLLHAAVAPTPVCLVLA